MHAPGFLRQIRGQKEGGGRKQKSVKHQSFLKNDCGMVHARTFVCRWRSRASSALLSRNCKLLIGEPGILDLGPGRLSGRLFSYQSVGRVQVSGYQETALPARAERGRGGFHPAPVPLQDCSEPSVFSIWNAGRSVSRAKLVEKGMQSYKKMWRRNLQAGLPLESYLFPTVMLKPYFGGPDCMQWNSSLFNSTDKITGE